MTDDLGDLIFTDNPNFVAEPRSHSCRITIDGRTVSHVGWDARFIKVDDLTVRVCAIGYVVTEEAVRHRRFASTLMLLAHDLARELGIKYAALFTGVPGLYVPLGYEYQENLSRRQPGGMVACLTDEPWPDGVVDLMGAAW